MTVRLRCSARQEPRGTECGEPEVLEGAVAFGLDAALTDDLACRWAFHHDLSRGLLDDDSSSRPPRTIKSACRSGNSGDDKYDDDDQPDLHGAGVPR